MLGKISKAMRSISRTCRNREPPIYGDSGVPPIDPAGENLSLWHRASYSGAPWVRTASAGGSGTAGRDLSLLTDAPDVGAALKTLTGADFDGVNEAFIIVSNLDVFTTPSAYTYIWAGVPRAASAPAANAYDDDPLFTDNASSMGLCWSTSGMRGYHTDSGGRKTTGFIATSSDSFHVVVLRYDGVNFSIQVDGSAWTNVAAGNLTGTGFPQWGKNYTSNYASCVLYESIMSPTAMSDATIAGIRSYLLNRYT